MGKGLQVKVSGSQPPKRSQRTAKPTAFLGLFSTVLCKAYRGCDFAMCYLDRVMNRNYDRIISEKQKSKSIKEVF